MGKNAVARIGYVGSHSLYMSDNDGAAVLRELNPATYVPGNSTANNTQARRAVSELQHGLPAAVESRGKL